MAMSFWSRFPLPYVSPSVLPVLSVGNLKGGVGKTAIVAYLAFGLVKRGYRVLAIDLDFQASLTISLAHSTIASNGEGTMNALLSNSSDIFFHNRVAIQGIPPWGNLTVVGSNLELADVEDSLFAELAKGKAKIDPRTLLAKKLADASLKGIFDIVLLDTPPRLTIAALNALCACTHMLIPTAPTTVSVKGVETYVSLLQQSKKAISPNGQILAVLPTLGPQHTLKDGYLKIFQTLERDIKPAPVWTQLHIPRRQAIADNKGYNDPDVSLLFEPLVDSIVKSIGLKLDGTNAGLRSDSRAGVDRRSLS